MWGCESVCAYVFVCVHICACVCMTFDISHGKPYVGTRFCLLFSCTAWAGLLELHPLMEIQPASLYVGEPFIGDSSLLTCTGESDMTHHKGDANLDMQRLSAECPATDDDRQI